MEYLSLPTDKLKHLGSRGTLKGRNHTDLAIRCSLYGDGTVLEVVDISAALKWSVDAVENEGRLALIDTVMQLM